MSQLPPIFVINLPKSVIRREFIENQLRNLNLEYQIIEAVNGKDYDINILNDIYKGRLLRPLYPYNSRFVPLSSGAIGCLMSHIKIYNYMIQNHIKTACVLEDDAKLLDNFPEVLKSAQNRRDWDVLLLGHHSMRHKSFRKGAYPSIWRKQITKKYFIAKPAEFPFTTIGYMIKINAAHKLREYAYPFRMPADWVTSNTELTGANLKIITPPAIIPKTVANEVSYIKKREVNKEHTNTQKLKQELSLYGGYETHKTTLICYIKFRIKHSRKVNKMLFLYRGKIMPLLMRIGLYTKSYTRPVD